MTKAETRRTDQEVVQVVLRLGAEYPEASVAEITNAVNEALFDLGYADPGVTLFDLACGWLDENVDA